MTRKAWNTGLKMSEEQRQKMSIANYKGSMEYSMIHKWVNKNKGRIKACERCGLSDPNRRYEWANISGVYDRDLNNYERLCVPCHRKKDGTDKIYMFSKRWQNRVLE